MKGFLIGPAGAPREDHVSRAPRSLHIPTNGGAYILQDEKFGATDFQGKEIESATPQGWQLAGPEASNILWGFAVMPM